MCSRSSRSAHAGFTAGASSSSHVVAVAVAVDSRSFVKGCSCVTLSHPLSVVVVVVVVASLNMTSGSRGSSGTQ